MGIITINEDNYNKEDGLIKLLNDDGSTWHSFTFYYDDSDGKWDFPNESFNEVFFTKNLIHNFPQICNFNIANADKNKSFVGQ